MSVYLVNNFEDLENNISLGNPQGIQGGAYLSKIKVNNDSLLLQLNKCYTKNAIVKTDKKLYCDLMFDIDDETTINFFTQFEETIKNLIFEKKDLWFHSDMDMDTIEYHWQSMLRQYQGNKYLLRTFIKKPKTHLSQNTLYIYDENETPLTLDDITKDKKLITIIKIASLKFTQQSFNIEIFLDQVMVLDESDDKPKCLIKKTNNNSNKQKQNNVTNKTNLNDTNLKENTEEPLEHLVDKSLEKLENDEIHESEDELENDLEDDIEDELEIDDIESINLDTINKSSSTLDKNQNSNDELKDEEIKENTQKEPAKLKEKLDNVKKDISLAINEKKQDIKSSDISFDLSNLDDLNEVDIDLSSSSDVVNLKPPNEVYNAIYKEVRRKAKEAKQRAIEAYLEVKRIKSLYGFNDIESSDEENTSEIL